jgi:positive regulator of sigma E activity
MAIFAVLVIVLLIELKQGITRTCVTAPSLLNLQFGKRLLHLSLVPSSCSQCSSDGICLWFHSCVLSAPQMEFVSGSILVFSVLVRWNLSLVPSSCSQCSSDGICLWFHPRVLSARQMEWGVHV